MGPVPMAGTGRPRRHPDPGGLVGSGRLTSSGQPASASGALIPGCAAAPRQPSLLPRSGPLPGTYPERWAGRARSPAPLTASETQLPTSSSPRRELLSEQEAASSLASPERTWGRAGRPTDPLQGPACPTPPRSASGPPATALPVGSRIPGASRGCSGYQRRPRGSSEGGIHPPLSSSTPVRGAPPRGRAWWFSVGARCLGTSEKMPAMRLFTCFLQLLAGLALPAVPPQVRSISTSQPGSSDLST